MELNPPEVGASPLASHCVDGAKVEILTLRAVPLGGLRAMTVARTLLQRRSLIGAWCFVDHYGPDRVLDVGGMDVAPEFPRVAIKPRFNVEPVARLDVRA